MDVGLVHAGAGDPDIFGLFLELLDRRTARVAHGGAQTADDLMHDRAGGSLVGNLPLDPFRHELERVLYVLLEVPVGGTARHGPQTAHPAIALVRAALEQEHLAGALI